MRGRARIILAVVGVIIFSLLLYFFFVSPKRNELADVNLQIEQEESRTAVLNAELQRLRQLQANEPELRAELEQIRSFVPVRPELANFIFQVQDAANAAGLDFVEITPELPKTPPEGAAVAQVRATIGATGGYFALQDFTRRLYNLDRALRVDTVSIGVQSLEPFGTRLTMTIAARVFYELPESAIPTTVGTPAPGVTPTPTVTP
jgi:Tfp pilus assembly protein PilO